MVEFMQENQLQAQRRNVSIDEVAILARARAGDTEAMEQLILKYQGRIYNVILKICANKDDAAELTQDTFVKAIEKIGDFQGKSSFYTWIFRIAVNHTLNYCKRKFKLGFDSLDRPGGSDSEQGRKMLKEFLADSASPDPVMLAQNKEIYELVFRAIVRLDSNQRAAVVLCDIEGMSYAQIAEVLEIGLGTVKSRLARGRKNLKEILDTVL